MRIENLLASGQVSPFQSEVQQRQQSEQSSSFPSSWGSDTVSFSPEAMAAAQKTETEDNSEGAGNNASGSAAESFSNYMDKARSKVYGGGGASSGGGGGIAEQIAALEKKAADLTSQIAQVGISSKLPDGTKDSQVEALNSTLNGVLAELAGLKSEQAEQQKQ